VALGGHIAPASFENDTQALLAILTRHQGKGDAITSRELARDLHLSTRVVREIIAQLVVGGQLIGASVDGNAGGYYMILAATELEETRMILRSRAREIFARDSALCRAWRRVHGQELQPLLPQIGSEE